MAACSDISAFKCPICLDIFEMPVNLGCDHIYCSKCVISLPQNPPHCPQCRKPFNQLLLKRDTDVELQLNSTQSSCQWCGKNMTLAKLRLHYTVCTKADHSIPKFKPIKKTSQKVPSHLPNRSTFNCPYCGQANLDNTDLVKHCNRHHQNDNKHVVCPICVAMPWGERERQSANFIQHLNLRHKFEYETYVDFDQDDEAMLQAAIQASLQDT